MSARSSRWLLTACLIYVPACESGETNDLKTLDAYSTGINPLDLRCAAAPGTTSVPLGKVTTFPEDTPSEDQDGLLWALAALPAGVQKFFMGDLRGEIVVTEDLKTICPNSAADGKTPICYVVLKDKDDNHRVKVAVTKDAKQNAREVTKMFGLLISDVYPKYSIPNPFPALFESIAKTYVFDLVQSGYFAKEEVDAILGSGASAALETKIDQGLNDYLAALTFGDQGTGSRTKQPVEDFQKAVFRSAFDSYYCNSHGAFDLLGLRSLKGKAAAQRNVALAVTANTRELMREIYPATTKMFDEIHKLLETLPAEDAAGSQGESTAAGAKTDEAPAVEEGEEEEEEEVVGADDQDAAEKASPKDKGEKSIGGDSDATAAKPDSDQAAAEGALLDEVCSLFEWAEGCNEKEP